MSTILSPFVYKIKGAVNYLLFDSVNKQLFSVTPEGDAHELETQLLSNGLVINSRGVIPFKFKPDILKYRKKLILRELQLRITGRCNINCANCGDIGKCKKSGQG